MRISHTKDVFFSKFQGAGNDFIVIHDEDRTFPWEDVLLIRRLCDRQLGVGADGLVLIRSSFVADYKMHIFNRDGLEASMCGNGLRCVVKYLYHRQGGEQSDFQIESARGVHACCIVEGLVKTALGSPYIHKLSVPLEGGYLGHLIDTGVPHVVVFSKNIQELDFVPISRRIRYHKEFFPIGVNVNFVEIESPNLLTLRTYERGIEEETLACGTGAAAAAVVAHQIYGWSTPIKIRCRSKEMLVCEIEPSAEGSIKIFLQGPAQHVFDGKVALYSL